MTYTKLSGFEASIVSFWDKFSVSFSALQFSVPYFICSRGVLCERHTSIDHNSPPSLSLFLSLSHSLTFLSPNYHHQQFPLHFFGPC